MILNAANVRKSFLDENLIKDATFHLEEREKAALIGPNGAGKTTLFRIISGELAPDGGTVAMKNGSTFGYLKQISDLDSASEVYLEALSSRNAVLRLEEEMRRIEALLSEHPIDPEALVRQHDELLYEFEQKGGYAIRSEVTGLLKGLGFSEDEFRKPVRALSGGEKTRLMLTKLLLEKPDLLLLDEPTNHLDIAGIRFLESTLATYPGAVFVISHDRYFLDRLVTKTVDLDRGVTRTYAGNYTAFAEKKRALRDAEERAYEAKKKEIERQEAVIERYRSFNRERFFKAAASREKALERLGPLQKPAGDLKKMHLSFETGLASGNDVLSVRDLRMGFGPRTLFSALSIDVKRGEKIALIGANGTGKTTLLKILNGELTPLSGKIRFGVNVNTGYYDQAHEVLHPEKTVFDELHDAYPLMDNTAVRTHLGAFLFRGDDVFKRISELSGGERGRVSLAKLMLGSANLLFLDEPTNHLDTDGKEVLEEALLRYEGTLLAVSHDRYFIERVADRILELHDGALIDYHGRYDEYLEKRPNLIAALSPAANAEEKQVSTEKQLRLDRKEQDAAKRKHERELQKAEERIAELEDRIRELDEEMGRPENATDAEKLALLQGEKEAAEAELTAAYEHWEKLAQE